MASSCGPLTLICLFVFVLVAASLAFAQRNDDRGRSMHGSGMAEMAGSKRRAHVGRRGNEGVARDNAQPGGRRRGARGRGRNPNSRRNMNNAGRRRGGRRRNRGGRQGAFSRRERKLVDRLSAGSSAFALQLYSRLRQDMEEIVFSPFSIHTALTMTYKGANSSTARQMMKVLNLKRLRKNKAHLAYAALTNSLTQTGNVTLNAANAVYVRPNIPIEEAFRSDLMTLYRAKFEQLDMNAVGGPEAPINAWVANKTEGMIRDLLTEGTIPPNVALVLINAVYFKGDWLDPFNADATTEQNFFKDGGSTARVQMMTRTAYYNYSRAEDLSAHVVELPYTGRRFSMLLLVPLERNTVGRLEEQLSVEVLDGLVARMRATNIELHLPKFKSESDSISVKDYLKAMGMRVPFTGRADFSGISPGGLLIDDVIHKAVVEVSEEGTEAAAATGVIVGLRSFPRRVTEVKADHPFLYVIRDNLSGTLLFMGKYGAHH